MLEKDIKALEKEYADYRLKEHIFPYISQRENWDCGVACLCMALGITYEEGRKSYFPKRLARGISGYMLARYTKSTELKRFPNLKSLDDYIDDKKSYILLTKSNKGDWGHYVIKDKNNNIYDPEYAIESIKDYPKKYVAFHILLENKKVYVGVK